MLNAIDVKTGLEPLRQPTLGLSKKEIRQYSLARVYAGQANGQGYRIKDGLEGDCDTALRRIHDGVHRAEGTMVPYDILFRNPTRRRDLNVTNFGQGGALVATQIETPIIELLRNRMAAIRLGAIVLDGLTSQVAIPRQVSAGTASSLPESQAGAFSTQALDQVLLTPHRVFAGTAYTKQLVVQSSVSVENFLRADLAKIIAIKWDYLILQGAGAQSEPTGILNTTGIGSLIFGGAATWANIIAFETALANSNADMGSLGFLTTPAVRSKLKQAPKIGTTFPNFVWEAFNWNDGNTDGIVNGYRAAVSNQVLNNSVVFGNWSDVILGLFGAGVDILVNPYSQDTEAKIRITANSFVDVACRHAASFVWSGDAGNQ